jgi:hypothetical protein
MTYVYIFTRATSQIPATSLERGPFSFDDAAEHTERLIQLAGSEQSIFMMTPKQLPRELRKQILDLIE